LPPVSLLFFLFSPHHQYCRKISTGKNNHSQFQSKKTFTHPNSDSHFNINNLQRAVLCRAQCNRSPNGGGRISHRLGSSNEEATVEARRAIADNHYSETHMAGENSEFKSPGRRQSPPTIGRYCL
jgi:hypothetical protein